MTNLNVEDRRNRKIAMAACSQIMLVGVKNMFVQAIPFLYARNSLLNMILFAVVAVMYINAFFSLERVGRVDVRNFLLAVFLILSYVLTFVFYPANTKYILQELPRVLPYCFVTCFMLTALRDIRWLEYYMRRYSVIIIACSALSAGFIYSIGHLTMSTWSTYSMPLSYVTMVAVMWSILLFFKEEKFKWLLLSAIGCLIIIAYGSRNPLLAIVVFAAIEVVRKSFSRSTGKKILWYWVVLLCLFFAVWRFDIVLSLAGNVLEYMGISSRTVTLLSAENASASLFTSGRDTIHATLLDALNERPFLGLGIAGDQTALYAAGMTQSAHSLYLSILSNYGYVVGSLVLVWLAILCIKALKVSDISERNILIMYMCMVWPRGFTGGDIWTSDVFWWMVGLCLAVIIKRKKE